LKNILKLKIGERDLIESISKLLVKAYGEATGTAAKVTKKKASKKKASKKKTSKKKISKKKASKKKASKKKTGKRGRPRKSSDGGFGAPMRRKKRHSKPKLLGDNELIY